jgi:hypothetical protein
LTGWLWLFKSVKILQNTLLNQGICYTLISKCIALKGTENGNNSNEEELVGKAQELSNQN